MTHHDPRVRQVIDFFERLTRDDVPRLATIYAPGARFKDPFNDVRGVEAIGAIFDHMFVALDAPRFVVLEAIAEGGQCFLSWDFHFRHPRLGSGEQTIHGSTHLRFTADGRIDAHRDYWDAAEELYERLPMVGALMRWLKRRAMR